MPRILHCDNVENGIELISSIERRVTHSEKKSRGNVSAQWAGIPGHVVASGKRGNEISAILCPSLPTAGRQGEARHAGALAGQR
jgi:hypothetical protein